MKKNDEIQLDFSTLTPGQHAFSFQLDDDFFHRLEQSEILNGLCTANVEVNARATDCSMHVAITGKVQVTCDRCLAPMDVTLSDVDDNFVIKLAAEAGEDDQAIYVAEDHPVFNLGWLLYETIAVRLPVVHSHPEGECDPKMAEILRSMTVEDKE